VSDKVKAAISYFLSAAAYAGLGIDTLTSADLSGTLGIVFVIVGAAASAFGIFWTAPKRS
jgi:hypothetical protein